MEPLAAQVRRQRCAIVGVSRDRKEADVDKFVGRLGTFMRELGERGITLGANFPLAFDPETQVGETFRTLSQLMSLAVGMCYVKQRVSSNGESSSLVVVHA